MAVVVRTFPPAIRWTCPYLASAGVESLPSAPGSPGTPSRRVFPSFLFGI